MDYEKAKLIDIEVEELACKITGLDYDEIDADTEVIEEKLIEEFGIDITIFRDLIERLLPLIDVGESPVTGKHYKGFSDLSGCWFTKMEIRI